MRRLLLIPGLAGNEVMWRAQSEGLRAFGPKVTDVHMRHDTIEAMAAALLAENAGEMVLCGASMGGMVAMEAARQAPDRVKALALLGTTARPESEEMREVRENAIRLFEAGRAREVIEPNVHFAFHPDHAGDPSLARDYLDFVLAAGVDQLVRQNRAVITRPDARLHLPRFAGPVLVMHGDSDQLVPPEHAQETASLLPQAQLMLLDRCGHMLTMERPAAVNAAMSGWLRAL